MTVDDESEATGRVQAVDRAVALLGAVAGSSDPETAQALAERCGLNRSTAWRLLSTLEHHGLVDRDPETNRYRIGLTIQKLAGAAGYEPLVRRARPLIRQLAESTGETALLAVPRGLELVYADQVQTNRVVMVNWVGRTVPLHATATGKVFLSALSNDELERAVSLPLDGYTETTITDLDTLRKELRRVRTKGYAESRGEYESMLWSVAAAVRNDHGRPPALVSLWGTEQRLRNRLDTLAAACLATAEELSHLLAGPR